jgi:hypothetical protein
MGKRSSPLVEVSRNLPNPKPRCHCRNSGWLVHCEVGEIAEVNDD